MHSLIAAFGAFGAGGADHLHDGGKVVAAVFAGIFFLFGAFIKLVISLVRTVRMTRTSAGCQ